MNKSVLVITDSFDSHADVICPKIERAGSDVVRFNTNQLSRYVTDIRPDIQTFSLYDRATSKRVMDSEIGSVWYRRPSPDESVSNTLDADGQKFFRGETKEFIKSISLILKNRFWVTEPQLLYEARIKAVQLSVASKIGLSVPRTLITMDCDLVKRFYLECQNGMIAKSLKVPYLESKDVYYTIRVQEISASDITDQSLYVCPTIFQEKISVLYELRIVAIGRRLFAFKATRKKTETLDIRTGGLDNVVYSPCIISTSLSRKIIDLLSRFQIPFSSMDFLVDKDGVEYFIDLNPNGQWLWLEFVTGVIMSDLFIDMLISRRLPT